MAAERLDGAAVARGWSHAEVLAGALRWCAAGKPVALATVLRTWGSSPRQPGSQLAVNDAREFVGSVSGGCVEAAVIEAASEAMKDGVPRTLQYGVSDEDAWAVGLACGGKVSVYVESLTSEKERLLGRVLTDLEHRRGSVVATRLADGRRWLVNGGEVAAELPAALGEAGAQALRVDRSEVVQTPEGEAFVHVFNPPLRLIVVGAVHIAQALAPMASVAGFEVVVTDTRPAFATGARFPNVTLIQGWPDDVLGTLDSDPRTAVVTLSHDPKLDDTALAAALRGPAFYIGALGSRRSHERRLGRLRERGFEDEELARIFAPVGLDLGAVEPAEIAVSILAQVVARARAHVASDVA